jgi:hypothetical protein
MRWSTSLSHETGHIVVGYLMGGELRTARADTEPGGGYTQFDFPPALKTVDDLDRLAFANALYSLSGIGAEWALSVETIDLARSTDDLEKCRKSYEADRRTPAFGWAPDWEFAKTVLTAIAEQAVLDHLEFSRYTGSLLASHNAIQHKDLQPFGRFQRHLGPGADWMTWATETMARASDRLKDQQRRHVERAVFDARYRTLQSQMAESREMDHGITR